ncbi:cytochrome c [Phenylobacterium sp.]|uniref:c-type cytochrome n=1 Tax=Phenylobacterium sp. TaxID=1871053 RepID=UPI0025D9CDD1|nr:cytochrome c [Phenylobacterium sp.]
MRRRVAAALAAGVLGLPASAAADGAKTYAAQCSVCHQVGGVGQAGVYPRLAGRAPEMAKTPAGRKLMIAAALFGMAGKLEVDGQSLMGVMPGFASKMTDAEIAEVLTYVAGLGAKAGGKSAAAFTAQEVAEARAGPKLSPTAVNALARGVVVK